MLRHCGLESGSVDVSSLDVRHFHFHGRGIRWCYILLLLLLLHLVRGYGVLVALLFLQLFTSVDRPEDAQRLQRPPSFPSQRVCSYGML